MPAVDAPDRSVPSDVRGPAGLELTDAAKAELLDLARLALAGAVQGAPDLALSAARTPDAAAGGQPLTGAAFVTLREGGELRGCIGVLDAASPIRRSVALAAVGAALHDWRFRPVTEFELPAIEVEVSVLGPITRLDDPLGFRLGVDGLLVARGPARGLLLPDVATTFGFDRVAMLEATCRKAGLAADAWCLPGTIVSTFQTVRFGGPAIALGQAAPSARPGI
jgi:AmmeMemoRadiSam system protein A